MRADTSHNPPSEYAFLGEKGKMLRAHNTIYHNDKPREMWAGLLLPFGCEENPLCPHAERHIQRQFEQPLSFQDCYNLSRNGAPGEIRTPDPLIRSQVLYPAELRARIKRNSAIAVYKHRGVIQAQKMGCQLRVQSSSALVDHGKGTSGQWDAASGKRHYNNTCFLQRK